MKNYRPETYGEKAADIYDRWFASYDEEIVNRLSELVQGGMAFELGIGTGRIALPLTKKGVSVDGIDSSPAMVAKLKEKAGGEKVTVQMGDFSSFTCKKKYDLVYVVFNTFFALLSQDEQVSCFKSVAGVLKPTGKFVMEAFVPDVCRFDRGQTFRTTSVEDNAVRMECSKHDLAGQTVSSQIIQIADGGISMRPVKIRYAWPSEILLMAKLTGFQLDERWANWKKEPFDSSSGFHISVFRKA